MNEAFAEEGPATDDDGVRGEANNPDARPNTPPNGSENNLEVTWDQSTSSGTAEVEDMTLELSDGKVKVESEALTLMADSTMKDGLGTADTPDSVVIRCCVERIKAGHSSSVCSSDQSGGFERDCKVIVPSYTMVGDLIQTVLGMLHYSEMDILGARGMIVIKNWKPMALEAITDDPLLRVGDLLTGLSTLVTLRIQLRCFAKYRQIEDVKEKLLYYLLKNSQELLQTTGCPIIKTEFEEILGDEDNIPEDLRNQFNDWYRNQLNGRRMRPTGSQSFSMNSPSLIRKEPQKSEHSGDIRPETTIPSGRVTLPPVKSLGRLWPDHDGECVRLKQRRKEGASSSWHVPLSASCNRTDDGSESRFNPVVGPHPVSIALSKDERVADAKQDASDDDEEERVPELPNRNAVYVIRPFPISGSGSESAEIVLSDNDSSSSSSSDEELSLTSPLTQDLSKTVRSSTAPNDKSNREDDGNYFLTDRATTLEQLPTNLSVRDVSKSSQPRDERTVSKADDVLARISSKRLGVLLNAKGSRGNDIDQHHLGELYIHAGEHYSPKQLPKSIPPSAFLHHPRHHHHNHHHQQAAASHLLALSQTMNFMRHLHGPPLPIHHPFQDCINESSLSDSDQRKRSRVFIDPISETPRLEEWFAVDSHPSTATIEDLTSQLNRSVYRQRFPRLEPKNVQLWFKNHRAKVKRLKGETATNGRL